MVGRSNSFLHAFGKFRIFVVLIISSNFQEKERSE